MTVGLQVFSNAGATLLDVQDKLTRAHSVITLNFAQDAATFNALTRAPTGNTGFYSIPGMNDTGGWYVFTPDTDGALGYKKFYAWCGVNGFDWEMGDVPIYLAATNTYKTLAFTATITVMKL